MPSTPQCPYQDEAHTKTRSPCDVREVRESRLLRKVDRFFVADRLREVARLLDLRKGTKFQARAYARAASIVEAIPNERFEHLVRAERLEELPGIGPSVARQVASFATEETSSLLERLRVEFPPPVQALAELQGINVDKARKLYDALGVRSVDDLVRACEEHRVRGVPGFGPKTEAMLQRAVRRATRGTDETRLIDALDAVDRLRGELGELAEVEAIDVAGAPRRFAETLREAAFVAVTEAPALVLDAFGRLPFLVVVERSSSSATARLASGLSVRLHVSGPEALGTAFFYATGSQEHVAAVERRARARGIDLETSRFSDEESLYRAAALPFIPPELREEAWQIDAVLDGAIRLPLVEAGDVRGATHCHSTHSDGRDEVLEMAKKAAAMGLEYITITDHSESAGYAGGIPASALPSQWDEIRNAERMTGVRVLRGTESDILADGALDYAPDILKELEIVIASIHNRMKMGRDEMTRRLTDAMKQPFFKIWGHPLGRILLRRDPIDCDVEAVLGAAASSRAAVEINGDPYRLDLPPRWIPAAKRRGLRFLLSSDAHSTGGIENVRFAVAMARRGGLARDDILNSLDVERFCRAVRPS